MNDRERKIDRPYLMHERVTPLLTMLVIATYWGLVMVHVDYFGTELHFVQDGRKYTRFLRKAYTKRHCITLADRFAGEIGMG